MFMHDNRKEDSSKKKKERIARAKKTRDASYATPQSSKEVKNGTKKS